MNSPPRSERPESSLLNHTATPLGQTQSTDVDMSREADALTSDTKEFYTTIRDKLKSNGPTELSASFSSVSQRMDAYVPYHRALDGSIIRPESTTSTISTRFAATIGGLSRDVDSRQLRSQPIQVIRPHWRNPHDIYPDLNLSKSGNAASLKTTAESQSPPTLDDQEKHQNFISVDKMYRATQRVLVVGQDVFSGGVISAILTRAGYSVMVCATAKEALTITQEQVTIFTLVLIQSTLLDAKIADVIPNLRNVIGRDTPMAVIVGATIPTGVDGYLDIGADDVLLPPYHQNITCHRIDTLVTFFWMRKRLEILTQDCRTLCSENESLSSANIRMQQRIQSLEGFLSDNRGILYENVLIRAQQEEVSTERENAKIIAHALLEKTKESVMYRRQLLVLQDRLEHIEKQYGESTRISRPPTRQLVGNDQDTNLPGKLPSDLFTVIQSVKVRFEISAPDWVHLVSQTPIYQMLACAKYVQARLISGQDTLESGFETPSTILQSAYSLVHMIQNRMLRVDICEIEALSTPKACANPLLMEWLQWTFGKNDHRLGVLRGAADVRIDVSPGADGASNISANENRRDSVLESRGEDTGTRRKSSAAAAHRPSIIGINLLDPRRGSKAKQSPATPSQQGKVNINSFLFTFPNRREWVTEAKYMFDQQLTAETRAIAESLRFDAWRLSDQKQMPLVFHFFSRFGLLDRFSIPTETLQALILAVRDTSGSGAFNNFTRSVDVIQGVYYLLLSSSIADLVTELDLLCLLLVAMSITLEHPGYTSRFMEQCRHNLFLLHGGQSTVEVHMHRVLHTLLHCPELNIFSFMTDAQITEAHEILGTLFRSLDVRTSLPALISRLSIHLPEFRQMYTPLNDRDQPHLLKKPIDYGTRMAILSTTLNIASYIYLARPAYIMQKWKDLYIEELAAQGVLEKSYGIPVSPFSTIRTDEENSWTLCTYMSDYIVQPLIHHARYLLTGFEAIEKTLARNYALWTQESAKKVLARQQAALAKAVDAARSKSTSPVRFSSSVSTPGNGGPPHQQTQQRDTPIFGSIMVILTFRSCHSSDSSTCNHSFVMLLFGLIYRFYFCKSPRFISRNNRQCISYRSCVHEFMIDTQ
eukprot:TRINITY_DN5530_c0_g1_i1.p1 TRINITY_DN5530_c0_g1~~TRINITY_DN5530_c0_g1_i1.p1  ORF type:complete len:1104 (+),score=194.62 TRINITY_DN5530_c0_g1_i1:117-3428(+)